jgi:hypothetical protein
LTAGVELASYKLMFVTRRVRAVPRVVDGAAFRGPGVDLLGESAEEALAAAAPIVRWLEAREPGVVVRSISVDLARPRALVTLEATPKPRVLRIEGAAATELLDEAGPLEALLSVSVRAVLRARCR